MSDENQPSIPGLPEPEGNDVNEVTAGVTSVIDMPSAGKDPEEPSAEVEDQGAVAASSLQPHEDAGRRYFYVTNRLNLNGILSSRIVAPREAYDKYYLDLLDRCPGWVPLLSAAPPPSVVNAVAVERGSGGPVIVEFTGKIRGLVAGDDSDYVYIPAVPLSEAVAIHLPDKKSLRELRARSYKNVYDYDDLVRVTPELFAGDTAVRDPVVPAAAHSIDWQMVDRVRGAVSAAISAAESGEQLALVARCLGAAISEGVADDTIPWLNWAVLNDLDTSTGDSVTSNATEPDLLLFKAAYDVIARTDASKDWSPGTFVDAVTQALDPSSTESVRAEIDRNLARVRQIINVEEEFKPFSGKGGLTSAKAMLLLSLRVDLAQLNSWPSDETGADDATRIVAAVFAGRLRGLSREDTATRSKEFDDITARWAVGLATARNSTLGDVSFVAEDDRTELIVDGAVIRRAEALLPDPIRLYNAVEKSERDDVRLKVASIMKWPIATIIRIIGDYEARKIESGAEIVTRDAVEFDQNVDEADFLRWLSETRRDRKALVEAFTSTQESKHLRTR